MRTRGVRPPGGPYEASEGHSSVIAGIRNQLEAVGGNWRYPVATAVYVVYMRSNSGREMTTPITTRLTSSMIAEVDALAGELKLTRGSVVTLLVAAALNQGPLLDTFRQFHTRARSREGANR
jgi:hypothetical protein